MTTQVTQCPNCRTSFRVTEAQLTIANGAVRCGSCLHIFNAPEHWLNTIADTENAAETPPQPDKKEAAEELDHSALDNIFDDDIFSDDGLDSLVDELTSSVYDDSAEAELGIDDEFELISGAENDRDISTDNYSTAALESDFIQPEIEQIYLDSDSDNETEFQFSTSLLELDDSEQDNPVIYNDLDNLNGDSPSDDDKWAQDLLDADSEEITATVEEQEEDQTVDDILENFDELEQADDNQLDPELFDLLNDQEQEPAPTRQSPQEDEFILGNHPIAAGEPIGADNQSLLANIEPEPVEFTRAGDHSRLIQRAWIVAIVAAGLLLAGQYITFNFERLARDVNYRPLLASACTIIGCQLPSMDDVSLIRSSNLMVRSHPTIADALVVDAIINNRASFNQQFPTMELQFTDLSGKPVAGRRFQPAEYLAGEMLGSAMMPSQQPVHISLEIIDPGEQAVNYQLRFYPAR